MPKERCNSHAGRSSVVVGALDQVGAACIAMSYDTRPLDGRSLHLQAEILDLLAVRAALDARAVTAREKAVR